MFVNVLYFAESKLKQELCVVFEMFVCQRWRCEIEELTYRPKRKRAKQLQANGGITFVQGIYSTSTTSFTNYKEVSVLGTLLISCSYHVFLLTIPQIRHIHGRTNQRRQTLIRWHVILWKLSIKATAATSNYRLWLATSPQALHPLALSLSCGLQ